MAFFKKKMIFFIFFKFFTLFMAYYKYQHKLSVDKFYRKKDEAFIQEETLWRTTKKWFKTRLRLAVGL